MGLACSIWVGWDPREAAGYAVARSSIARRLITPIPVKGVLLEDLTASGLYTRPMQHRPGPPGRTVMWDVISDAPMSTEHANARFLVPHLAKSGWAMFLDGDTMARTNVARIFEGLSKSKAVYCVQHRHEPEPHVKMDGQAQTRYARKNWSSVCIFNCDHPSNRALSLDLINSAPGRDLHRFFWLDDDEIGELDPAWNFLVGHSPANIDPKIVHFTEGLPDMAGYDSVPYADEWRAERRRWAA